MKSEARAVAKFILCGEHFIVHGGLFALSFPITSLSTKVEVEMRAGEKGVRCQAVSTAGGGSVTLPQVSRAMNRVVMSLCNYLGLETNHYGLEIASITNIPISKGFGSSASFAVALSRAIHQLMQTDTRIFQSTRTVSEMTTFLEKAFHGNPSGVDAETILMEQPIRFEKGSCGSPIENSMVDFVLVDSGSRDVCKNLVFKMAQLREQRPDIWQKYTDRVRDAGSAVLSGLKEKNLSKITFGIEENQKVLSALGLSTSSIEDIITKAKSYGALAGKVSGAGAGGCTVIVCRAGTGNDIAEKLRASGVDVIAKELSRARDKEKQYEL
jgi:mevalonate kinase